MHILHVEKMLFAPSGVTSYVRAISVLQAEAGHRISTFGCDRDGGDRRLPGFRDFRGERRPPALWPMIHNARAADLLEQFLRGTDRVDVAHVHNIYHHLTPAILPALARRRVPIVMSVHDYRLLCPAKHFLRPDGVCTRCLPHRLYHAASRRCAGFAGAGLAIETFVQRFFRRYVAPVETFICPNDHMRAVLKRVGVPASKLAAVPNVVDSPKLSRRLKRRERRLLYAGRLAAEKGPDLMLELAAKLSDCEVVIAGGGAMLEELRAAAEQRKLANVTFTGPLDRRDLAGEYARATAVVLPSRCMENSPQTMLEAMACGRAVIVADHAPLRHWVADGQTARTFAPGSGEALATVVGEVLSAPAAREKMEKRAAELIARRHAPAAITGRIEQIYQEARRRCELRW